MNGFDFTLLRPGWLLALLAVALLGGWLWPRRGGLGDWVSVADPHLLAAMTALGRVDRSARKGPLMAALAVAGLSVLALAGPALERRDTLSYRNLDGVLFVVDASASVVEDARWPQMLTMGRFGLASLGTRPGGLIVYGGDAYVAADMTEDHLQLGQTFSLIDAKTVPDKGSRPERGLALAAKRMREAEVIAGDVVLFTDGAGFGAASLAAAAEVAAAGARVSFLSLGGSTADLEAHAALGGGRVFGLNETDALGDWLAEDARTRLEAQDFPLLFWHDMGRYLLILAMVPLLLMFRKETA